MIPYCVLITFLALIPMSPGSYVHEVRFIPDVFRVGSFPRMICFRLLSLKTSETFVLGVSRVGASTRRRPFLGLY
jgi:hypothetical protein